MGSIFWQHTLDKVPLLIFDPSPIAITLPLDLTFLLSLFPNTAIVPQQPVHHHDLHHRRIADQKHASIETRYKGRRIGAEYKVARGREVCVCESMYDRVRIDPYYVLIVVKMFPNEIDLHPIRRQRYIAILTEELVIISMQLGILLIGVQKFG